MSRTPRTTTARRATNTASCRAGSSSRAQRPRPLRLSVPAWLPRVTYAQTESLDRDVLVSIFLRGGSDGLTMVPPFGEAAYYSLRPTIAIPRPDSGSPTPAISLDGFFGLPTAMAALVPAYQSGQLLIVHATGSTDPIAFPLRRAVLHGGRQARRQEHRHRVARAPSRRRSLRCEPDAALRAIGFAFGLPQTLVGAPEYAADSQSRKFRPGWKLVDAHAAAGVSGQLLPDRARSAQDGGAQHAANDQHAERAEYRRLRPRRVARSIPTSASARRCARRRRSSARTSESRRCRSTSADGIPTARRAR